MIKTIASAFVISFVLAATASAQDRTALVVSNFDYGEHQLTNAKADAAAVSEALRREGFRVTEAENVPGKDLKSTVEKFVRSTVIRGEAVFYFAGLSGQYPVSDPKGPWKTHLQGAGKPADPTKPDREMLPLSDILKLFADHSAARTNCLVLDAAWANPFLAARENQPVGLAAVEAAELPDDTVVLLAAQPGTNAGKLSEPSRLASAIAKQLSQGRESVGKMLPAIVQDVEQQGGGQQKPSFVGGRRIVATAWPAIAPNAFLNSETPRDGERAGQEWINGLGMVFCWCPPGKFSMGSSDADRAGFGDAKPVEVTLTKGFWMAKYEVTLLEGQRAGQGLNSKFTSHKLAPFHNVQPGQTGKIISKVIDTERKAGRLPDGWEYALPTEAEWEYACRAGATTKYSFGDDVGQLHRFANFADKSLLAADGSMLFAESRFDDSVGKTLAPVGSYLPNAWGLHDMHGNVAEWCIDQYLSRLVGGTDPRVNVKEFKDAKDPVIRGGAWCSTPASCEAGYRNSDYESRNFIGYRIVLRKK